MDFSPGLVHFWNQASKLLFSLGSHFSFTSLGAALLIATLFYAVKRIRRGRKLRAKTILRALFPKRIVASPSNYADVGYLFFNVFVFGVVFGWAVLTYETVTNGIISNLVAAFGQPSPSSLPGWLSRSIVTLMLFLAYELGYWFNHWLCHRVPLLWEFHKVHHSAEVLTPLTNFRVHPVYTWIFANILALSAAIANGFANYMFGETDASIRARRQQHHPGAVHPCVRASAALACVDRVQRLARTRFREPGAPPDSPLDKSEALQPQLRQLPRFVGLDVRHALRAGQREREAQLRRREGRISRRTRSAAS